MRIEKSKEIELMQREAETKIQELKVIVRRKVDGMIVGTVLTENLKERGKQADARSQKYFALQQLLPFTLTSSYPCQYRELSSCLQAVFEYRGAIQIHLELESDCDRPKKFGKEEGQEEMSCKYLQSWEE